MERIIKIFEYEKLYIDNKVIVPFFGNNIFDNNILGCINYKYF
jgi:hypothetical protein